MKILVTGGAGFIGSHLADRLLGLGHEVQILDNFYSGTRENIAHGVKLHELDIVDPQVLKVLADEKFDVIFHEAAQLDVRKSVDDPTFDANVNILGSINLLEGALRNGVKKFIFASSGGAGYGEQDYFPADEQHPIRPLSPYGITKVTVERYMYYYQQIHGLQYVSLRYANVYGPRQSPHGEAGVVAIFARRMLKGVQPVINGDGKQTRDFVYVADVVDANICALNYAGSGCFNVGTGIETDVIEVFDQVNQNYGGKFERVFAEAKAGEQRRSVLTADLLKKEMGWAPKYDFAAGMKETLAWFAKEAA